MMLSGPMSAMRPGFGDEKSITLMAAAGFDAIDYTFNEMYMRENVWNQANWREYAIKLVRKANECKICFNQAHAPFLFNWEKNGEMENWILPTIKHSFECAASLGIPHMIVHPIHHIKYKGNEKYLWDWNMEYYKELISVAKNTGVQIALENMLQLDEKRGCIVPDVFAKPQEYVAFYDALASDEIIACVDIGHSGPTGEDPVELLKILGSRVRAIHVHDNCFRNDDHFLPYMGKIDWEAVTKTLADIDYKGDFTFEVTNFLKHYYPEPLISSALKFEHDVGRYLISRIEAYKR
ncbi:sugar phosphate isomerase/epimerase [Treponema parvum]|uniref:Sugar phosphate isomerase/epimerase n=1 Tax=Treponema parvum TaxID=138851 RepID=A0A975F227_9SPIR|nr:sugar phosphate isomerase/epimerase family protein [Treponema parvum]QTQ12996.1 sugar phosphate isomerase/epimerase [Treponema parvum]